MTNTSVALRIASDAILRDIDTIDALEAKRRGLPSTDPGVPALARQAKDVASRLLVHAAEENLLSSHATQHAAHGATINDTSRSLSSILGEWREAERNASVAVAGSAAALEAAFLCSRLRDEYRVASDDAARAW